MESFKMFTIKLEIVWFFIFVHVSHSERRIQEGMEVTTNKKYVVYLVKAPLSRSGYDFWLCGGALVTEDFVVTSAACIKDIDYLYVIAGYKKYVTDNEIENDECTRNNKKKVIYTCFPDEYDLKYDQLDSWSLIDIGIVKVESPYDFSDRDGSFKKYCHYVPGVIKISYDSKHRQPTTDAIVFGWGHRDGWRTPNDTHNYNEKNLMYAPVMIIDKEECKTQYEKYGKMPDVIDRYMICSLGPGLINDAGDQIKTESGEDHPLTVGWNGCHQWRRKSWAATNPEDPKNDCNYEGPQYDDTRRERNGSNRSITEKQNVNNINQRRGETNRTTQSYRTNKTAFTKSTTLTKTTLKKPFMFNKTVVFNETIRDARRSGICQNDHGGPLVTWVATHEVLIGVASVFKITQGSNRCTGPYLYTSTQCNGAFLNCVLTKGYLPKRLGGDDTSESESQTTDTRRSFCRSSKDDKRHPTMERHISWLSHPAGPADHERHLNQPEIRKPDVQEQSRNEEIVNESEWSKNPSNQRYPLNKNPSVNVGYAPNWYKANGVQNVPNTGANNAPNQNYGTTLQHGPDGIPITTNDKYTPNKAPVSNNGPDMESMKRFKLSYRPETIYEQAQKNEAPPAEPALYNRPAAYYRNEAPKQIERTLNSGVKFQVRQQVPLSF